MYIGSGKIERLTKRDPDGGINVSDMRSAVNRLASFEDLEESGRLARLPCKLGATAYLIGEDNRIFERKVIGFHIVESGLKVRLQITGDFACLVDASLHGSDWFLNRANAEAELASRKREARHES